MKFKKNDEIIVSSGKDRGKRGKIDEVFPKTQEVIVAGVNIYKKHSKPRAQDKPGGIIDKTMPLSVAKIALICPKCGKPTRIGYQKEDRENKSKLRVCRKCGGVV